MDAAVPFSVLVSAAVGMGNNGASRSDEREEEMERGDGE